MTLHELGELAVVVTGQVVADLAELLVDDREVVDEPFGRRRDRTLVLDRPGQNPVRVDQHTTVVRDAGLDGVSPMGCERDRLCGCQRTRVLFEPLDAEQFVQDRAPDARSARGIAGDHGPVGLGRLESFSSSAFAHLA